MGLSDECPKDRQAYAYPGLPSKWAWSHKLVKSASTILDIWRSVGQVQQVAEKAKLGKSVVRPSIGLA